MLAVALFSLAGMPLFAGFVTKFILFQSVADDGYSGWPAIAVVTSFISLYYYLQVMREVFVTRPTARPSRSACRSSCRRSAVVLMLGVFFVGLYPPQLFDAADNATSFLFI